MTESDRQRSDEYPFLRGGGEMGNLLRNMEWEKTHLDLPGGGILRFSKQSA